MTVAHGEDIVVAEAVLVAGAPRQFLLLHRTLGRPGGVAEHGARVEVRDSAGGVAVLTERPRADCFAEQQPGADSLFAACYGADSVAIVPGGLYELHIETTDGRVLAATTRVPGAFNLHRPPAGTVVCSVPPGTTLEIAWSPSDSAWVYLVEASFAGLREALAARGIDVPEGSIRLLGLGLGSEDTTIVFPTEFGIFERFGGLADLLLALRDGAPAGVSAVVTVAAADRNFVNWARSGGFNPSGNVRVPSVRGDGTGSFGSLVRRTFRIEVGDTLLPPCNRVRDGRRLTGAFAGGG